MPFDGRSHFPEAHGHSLPAARACAVGGALYWDVLRAPPQPWPIDAPTLRNLRGQDTHPKFQTIPGGRLEHS